MPMEDELTPEFFMRRALELARRAEGLTRPNPAVGAVVVRDGRIVGEGFHPEAGAPHAEILALQQAGELARGATLYVTLEPCCHTGRTGPCSAAVIGAGIAKVVVGTRDPNPRVDGGGLEQLRSAGLMVECGMLEDESRRLIAPFAKHVTTGLPFVTLKAAVTLDGQVATRTGESQWITNELSRQRAHRLRHVHDAILVGIGTVLADNPRLTTRLPAGGGKDPLRIVVDSRLRTPPEAALLHGDSRAGTVIATTADAPQAAEATLRAAGAEVLRVPGASPAVDLRQLLCLLGARGVQSILLEGGGRLNHAAWQAGIVDRVSWFLAPLLLGGSGIPSFCGAGVARLSDAFRLQDVRIERLGDDVLVEGEVTSCSRD